MIGLQEQQKQNNVLNRSQRRTPLNVVVEKIGSARAVVHGDLSKETLKELLMSELSLISKVQSTETKDAMTQEGRRELQIDEESKLMETDNQELKSEKDYRNIDIILQEQDKDVSSEFQKGQKDFGKGAKTTEVEQKDGNKYQGDEMGERQNEDKERQGKIREDKDIAKKSDKNHQNEETENVEKNSKNEYEDQEKSIERNQIITSQQTKDILQEKEKTKITDRTVKYLFRKKGLKTAEKEIMLGKENREIRSFIMKVKNAKKNGHFDVTKQIEEISNDQNFTEDYEKEDRESCFSKISSDKDISTLSYDGKWLKQYLKKPLILAMNEIVEKKPKDPVTYLGFWLLNYRSAQENEQRKRALETELLSKRNEWNMLHAETTKIPELIVEKEEASEHLEEGENIVDWNFSSYGFK